MENKYFEDYTEHELDALADEFLKKSIEDSAAGDNEEAADDEDYTDESDSILYGHDFYLRNLSQRFELLSQKETEEYLQIYNSETADDEEKKNALEKIFNSIDPLLERMAKKFRTRTKDMDDLISEAHIRIVESGALKKYDSSKGKLFTYLNPVVKNTWILNYSKETQLSGINAKLQKLDSEIILAADSFYMVNGRYPTDDELADMDIAGRAANAQTHEQRVEFIREIKKTFTQSKTQNLESYMQNTADDSADMDRSPLLRDDSAEARLENCENVSAYENLRELMRDVLSSKEYVVMVLRNGMYTDRCYTTREIAKELGVTRTRVGQIYLSARKKIREKLDEQLYLLI